MTFEEEHAHIFRHLKILVVDDEEYMLAVLRANLRRLGAPPPVCMSDGLRALSRLIERREDYDLIISDLNMPGMNGLEFLKRLRSSGSRTPFIMLTGNQTHDAVRTAADSGVDAYVVKPFSVNHLAQKIVSVLKRRAVS